MSVLKVSQLPVEMKDAIEKGFVFDDSGNDVSKTGTISRYDHNGDPENMLLCYRLFDDNGKGTGYWLNETNDCLGSYCID